MTCCDCGNQKKIHARKRCTSCYRRLLKSLKSDGAYVPIIEHPQATPLEKVMSRVDKQPDGCWLYTGALMADGYARVKDASQDVAFLIHRVTYEELAGPIPEGLVLDHLCRVRHCVNPEHLEPVTNVENIQRGFRSRLGDRTHCSEGHEFTPENTTLQRKTTKEGESFSPICRTCRNAQQRAKRKREGQP